MKLLEWEAAPGAYRVAFTTRLGGISGGPFESLNLGILTEDDPTCVVENRRRLAAAVGADPETATMAWQVHGNVVTEAKPRGILVRTVFERCDGLWSDRPGQAMALLTADCYPVALARATGDPALCVLHDGGAERKLDLAEATERALRRAGVVAVERAGRCTACEPDLFFSHRRDGGRTGRQGVIAYIR
jgi:copper oxidase (laccase) domain-containing protein